MLPTNESMIEELLADTEPAARERITAAYPGYPTSSACIQLGGDFAFSSAAWQIAEAHSRHAPTYLYRYDYAPRTLRWSGLGATHATELLAVFDFYRTRFGALLTAAADRRRRAAGQQPGATALAGLQPHRGARRRLARLHRRRSRRDGLRPQVPHRVRSAPAAPDGLGRLLIGAVTWHADSHGPPDIDRDRARHRTTQRSHSFVVDRRHRRRRPSPISKWSASAPAR